MSSAGSGSQSGPESDQASETAFVPRDDVQRALVVTAHPDDADFAAAGTIATWTKSGIAVAYCICTSGGAGGHDDTPREQMPELREAEQRAAAAEVGVSDLTFLRYPDGSLTVSTELRRDISREIRRFRPQRVLTHSPEFWWRRLGASHPDHRACGEAALDAVYPDARNPFAHPELLAAEGLEPWMVEEVWLTAAPDERHNHVVDVTDVLDQKLAALRAHASQTAHMGGLDERVGDWLRATARTYGLGDERFGEVFQVITIG